VNRIAPSGEPTSESTRVAKAGVVLLIMIMIILGVCSGGSSDSAADDADAAGADVVENEATPTATTPPAPTPTATAVPLPSAEEIYAELSPSIAYIVTADGASGSGVLIEGGYVVTNHHVLEFDTSARIVFPNGTEIADAPVFATNPQADLAIMGPIDTALPEVPLTGVEVGRPGSKVFLVGYPDEADRFPEATLTQGIVSRYREMPLHGYNFVQIDALIAPGQSGGVMVNDMGEIVGISGLRFGEGNFGLVMDAPTVRTELDQMFEDPLDFTRVPVGNSADVTVPSGRAAAVLVDVEDELSVTATSDGDISLEVITLGGGFPPAPETVIDYFLDGIPEGDASYADETVSGVEELDLTVQPGRYIITLSSFEEEDVSATIEANVDLFEFVETDDGRSLELGEPVEGLYDFPTDSDVWNVALEEGQRIRVQADSISDVVVVIRLDGEAVASGDDDLVGLFGSSVDFEFDVPSTDTYELIIGRFGVDTGGYIMQLDEVG